MSVHQLSWNATTKVVAVQTVGDAVPVGSRLLPNYIHDDTGDKLGAAENHVLYHHVRDALYDYGHMDMSIVSITLDTEYIALTALSSSPATVTKAVAATQQVTNTFTPSNASNQEVTYTSSDVAKATVSASGLITAVASGTATITVTSVDGAFTDTVVVTIS